jgi:TfoX/Sxy family transcriptional regulator of competence genes
MAYDEGTAQRVRDALIGVDDVIEKKMFGGLCFMVRGHMCTGITIEDLMVRVGPDSYTEALTRPHAREMDFTGKALKGFVYVDARKVDNDAEFESWINLALDFVQSLPPK